MMPTPTKLGRRKGFALILVVTLLSMLVLVLIGFTSLAQIEIRVAASGRWQTQARQNALLALDLAIAELQRQAGPDQRITTAARIRYTSANNPNWTGVWSNSDTSANPVWMVSGATVDGNVTFPGTGSAEWMVANGSADATGHVWAHKIDIEVPAKMLPGLSATDETATTIGRYAWWVGDEGLKARINLRDVLADVSATSAHPRRHLVAQRAAPEQLSDFGSMAGNTASFARVDVLKQLQFIQNGPSALQVAGRSHSLTASSSGVLADAHNGGLRLDLSPFLAGIDSPAITASAVVGGTATWDSLRGWGGAGLSAADFNQPITPFAPNVTTRRQGLHPVIVRFALFFTLTKSETGGSVQARFIPVVALWNPYDVILGTPPGGYRIQLGFDGVFSVGNATRSSTSIANWSSPLRLLIPAAQSQFEPGECRLFIPAAQTSFVGNGTDALGSGDWSSGSPIPRSNFQLGNLPMSPAIGTNELLTFTQGGSPTSGNVELRLINSDGTETVVQRIEPGTYAPNPTQDAYARQTRVPTDATGSAMLVWPADSTVGLLTSAGSAPAGPKASVAHGWRLLNWGDGNQSLNLWSSIAELTFRPPSEWTHPNLTQPSRVRAFTGYGWRGSPSGGSPAGHSFNLLFSVPRTNAPALSLARLNNAQLGSLSWAPQPFFVATGQLGSTFWNRYFLSGISSWSGVSEPLPNQRFRFYRRNGALPNMTSGDPVRQGAVNLLVDGSFNVNSTSGDAWRAFVFGTWNLPVTIASSGTPEQSASLTTSRFVLPWTQSLGASETRATAAAWGGYRRLTEAQASELATWLATWPSRRTIAGITSPYRSIDEWVNDPGWNTLVNQFNLAGSDGLKLEDFPLPIPGVLTKWDVLAPLLPFVAVRSDTFRVRAYGEAINAILDPDGTGTNVGPVEARAWCEAIVQRVPDKVDGSDPTTNATGLGRRFVITSFRWLTPADI